MKVLSCLVWIFLILLLGALFIFLYSRFPDPLLTVLSVATVLSLFWVLIEGRREYSFPRNAAIVVVVALIATVIYIVFVNFPSSQPTNLRTAQTLRMSGQCNRAIQYLDESLSKLSPKNPEYGDLLLERFICLAQSGSKEKAQADYLRAVEYEGRESVQKYLRSQLPKDFVPRVESIIAELPPDVQVSLAQGITPTPTPIVALGTLTLQSEVQPDGTVKNSSSLSVNSLGVGDLLLTYPQEINIRDSALVRLSITPSKALVTLQSVAVPTQNPTLPPPFRFTDRIDIYPVMQAELSGAGFEITPDPQPLKAVVSDKPTEWTWTLKPKEEGSLLIVVRISVPVRVDGVDKYLFTTLKNIPAEIKATKSLQNRIDENLPAIISALIALISGIVGFYVKSRIEQRDRRIAEVEKQGTIIENEIIETLKAVERKIAEMENRATTIETEISETLKAMEQRKMQRLLSPDSPKKTKAEETADKERLVLLRNELDCVQKEVTHLKKSREVQEIADKEKVELLRNELLHIKGEIARLKAIPKWQFWRT